MSEGNYRPQARGLAAKGPSLDDVVSKNVMAQLKRDPPPRHGEVRPARRSIEAPACQAP
jgi:hypothetical protein